MPRAAQKAAKPICPFCRAGDKPGSVAYALGLVDGMKLVRDDITAFTETICDAHAPMVISLLRPRVTSS